MKIKIVEFVIIENLTNFFQWKTIFHRKIFE